MSNLISIPPIKIPTPQLIPYSFLRPIQLDESCVLALLPGDNGAAKWVDKSGKGNHGVVTGASLSSKGRHGPAYHFDEVDDHIIVPDFSYGPYFTVCIWLKLDDNAGSMYQYLFSHGTLGAQNSINMYIYEDGSIPAENLRVRLLDSNDITNNLDYNNFADTDWHFVCATVGSDGLKLYTDGIFRASNSNGGDAFNPATDIYIGAREDLNVDRHFGGLIDGVYIFNRTLSAAEILNIYNQGI
jgi:Concanavalin A-like lectin/glucanases superfamily